MGIAAWWLPLEKLVAQGLVVKVALDGTMLYSGLM
jgi:hypothetical protein